MKWGKIILILSLIFIISCRKLDVEPIDAHKVVDVFSVKEVSVTNEDPLNFNLNSAGIYTLTLFDSTNQQVVARERIIGKIGNNSLKLYTKSLPVRYLYLSLEDDKGVQIGNTLLLIK